MDNRNTEASSENGSRPGPAGNRIFGGIPFGNFPKVEDKKDLFSDFCKKHAKVQIQLFCVKCQIPICIKCKVDHGKDCSFIELDQAFEKFKKIAQGSIEKKSQEACDLDKSISKIKDALEVLEKTSEDAHKALDAKTGPVIAALTKYVEKRESEINDIVQQKRERLELQLKRLKQSQSELEISKQVLINMDDIPHVQLNKIIENCRTSVTSDKNAIENDVKFSVCEEELSRLLQGLPFLECHLEGEDDNIHRACDMCHEHTYKNFTIKKVSNYRICESCCMPALNMWSAQKYSSSQVTSPQNSRKNIEDLSHAGKNAYQRSTTHKHDDNPFAWSHKATNYRNLQLINHLLKKDESKSALNLF